MFKVIIFMIVRFVTLSFLLPYMLLQRKETLYGKKESFDVFVESFPGAPKKQRVSSQKTGKGYRVPADFW